MQIKFGRKFKKQYAKAPSKVQQALEKRILLLSQDPTNLQLNNHALTGQYKGLRSINITGDWRALFAEVVTAKGEMTVIFELLGTHSQLYH